MTKSKSGKASKGGNQNQNNQKGGNQNQNNQKKGQKKGNQNKQTVKYIINCASPVEDNIMDPSQLEAFLKERIKVDNKLNNLAKGGVEVSTEKKTIVVKQNLPFSKRYLKYLTKKYLKKQQLRDFLHVVQPKRDMYELKYFDINQDEEEES